MDNQLGDKKVTGEVLVVYDTIIRAWVLDQLKDSGASINENRVQEMIDAALESFDSGVTKDDLKSIINEMVSDGELSIESPSQFKVVSDKIFETADQIASEFPVGESSNVILDNVTIGNPPNAESFQNVVANITNSPDGTITVVTNDGRTLEFSYDTSLSSTEATLSKSLSSSTSELADSITTIQQTINNIETNSLTEARVQEMIDESVGAAISDSY